MLVKTFGAAVQGINAIVVTIEVNISNGVKFFLVGLPDDAVKESHERIASALDHNGLRSCGFEVDYSYYYEQEDEV